MSEKVHDRLDSWKAIAEYLDRDPTTVMRWAKERGLPVYTVPGEGQRRRAVYAYTVEIDAWLKKPATAGWRNDSPPHPRRGQGVVDTESGVRSTTQGAVATEPGAGSTAPGTVDTESSVPSTTPSPLLTKEGSVEASSSSRNRFLAPLGMTVPSKRSPWPRLGMGRRVWAVFLGGAILIAVAAVAWFWAPSPEPKVLRFEQLTNDGFTKGSGPVTDGARIYFIEDSREGWIVAAVPVSGGSTVTIARADRDTSIQDISPNRTELLLVHEPSLRPGSVWVLSLQAGSSRRLGAIEAFSAAWSPDGAALAYTTDDGLYICDVDGSHSRRVLAISGKPAEVHWSPDGQQLCFTQWLSNQTMLWEVGRNGKGLRRMFAGEVPLSDGESGFWTGDGRYFILWRCQAGQQGLWVRRLPSGLLRRKERLTRLGPAGLDIRTATLSPDGSRLFSTVGTMTRYQMARFDAHSERFVPFLPDLPAGAMDFTKDGQWVAYAGVKGGLWKSHSDGSGKLQLTLSPLQVELPRWSPDGKWIAFMAQEPGRSWKVRVISAEGGPYEPVTSTDEAEGAPTWSPDGSRLAFGGLVDPVTRTPGTLAIHVFDLKARRLSAVPGSEGLWTARWSPDGRHIAALTKDSCDLMLFDFATRRWTKILTLGRITDLRWSWQGRFIYLINKPPRGERTLFRVRIPGHQLERLASLAGTDFSEPLGLAPDGSPLVSHAVNTTEIYALECRLP